MCSRRPLRSFLLLLLLFTGIPWQTRLIIPALLPDVSRLREREGDGESQTDICWVAIAATSRLHILNIFNRAAGGVRQRLKFAEWCRGVGGRAGGCGILYE